MKNAEMHLASIFGSIVIVVALVVPTVLLKPRAAAGPPPLEDMPAIEASIAYKKPNAPKQPQKQFRAPDPVAKPEGVSHDETKTPIPPKPDEAKPKPNPVTDPKYVAPDRTNVDDEDLAVGKPDQQIGSFDGEEFGVGDVTKGDPYFGRLSSDLHRDWNPPELATGSSEPVGCIQITPDGKIPQTKFQIDTNDDLGLLAHTALKKLQDKRNADPDPVPTRLLRELTTKWICFKFTAKPQG